jgi:arabinan endo-1,5-alpha-L-arabinosidase
MLLTNALSASLAALAWAPAVYAYANPGACSGVCTNVHDPSIIRRQSDGTYFRFSTGNKIAIHTAPSISGPWTYKCAMLPSGSSIQLAGNHDLWAPDVSQAGSDYYVYYTVSTFGAQNSAIGLATSATMDCGSFRNLGTTGVESRTGDNYNAIDGNLLKDGSSYLFNFGSFYSNLYQVNMANPPTKSSGSQRPLAFEPAGEHPEEAPYMVKYGSYYYLFYSVGKCCGYDASRPAAGAEYKIKVCRSATATGGFVSLPTCFLFDAKCKFIADSSSTSTPQESLARRAAVRLCSSRTAMSTVLVGRDFTTIQLRVGCCIITMLIRILGMLMGRSSLVGIRLPGRMGGRLCRSFHGGSRCHERKQSTGCSIDTRYESNFQSNKAKSMVFDQGKIS